MNRKEGVRRTARYFLRYTKKETGELEKSANYIYPHFCKMSKDGKGKFINETIDEIANLNRGG